ncbi:protein phosphatase 2C domain-containing protein [Flindersiella endophytica]
MQVSYATLAGDPGVENEDFVAASTTVAVVLDGVTPVDRADTGCRHGVAWYARTVGAQLLATATATSLSLSECLAGAIAAGRRAHQDTCDLDHPDSPAATVAAVRLNGDESADYLVLADCTVVLDSGAAEHRVVTDSRPADVHRSLVRSGGKRLPARQYRATYRNQPGGYWVAAGDPAAAAEALTGTVAGVRRIVATSDGASRLVDQFGRLAWPAALEAISESGPGEWIARTRTYECELANTGSAPTKPHDDATVVLLTEVGRGSR